MITDQSIFELQVTDILKWLILKQETCLQRTKL